MHVVLVNPEPLVVLNVGAEAVLHGKGSLAILLDVDCLGHKAHIGEQAGWALPGQGDSTCPISSNLPLGSKYFQMMRPVTNSVAGSEKVTVRNCVATHDPRKPS